MTPTKNLKRILKYGLVPTADQYQLTGIDSIYLYTLKNEEQFNELLSDMEEMQEVIPHSLLEIKDIESITSKAIIDPDYFDSTPSKGQTVEINIGEYPFKEDTVRGAVIVTKTIPPQNIRIVYNG